MIDRIGTSPSDDTGPENRQGDLLEAPGDRRELRQGEEASQEGEPEGPVQGKDGSLGPLPGGAKIKFETDPRLLRWSQGRAPKDEGFGHDRARKLIGFLEGRGFEIPPSVTVGAIMVAFRGFSDADLRWLCIELKGVRACPGLVKMAQAIKGRDRSKLLELDV